MSEICIKGSNPARDSSGPTWISLRIVIYIKTTAGFSDDFDAPRCLTQSMKMFLYLPSGFSYCPLSKSQILKNPARHALCTAPTTRAPLRMPPCRIPGAIRASSILLRTAKLHIKAAIWSHLLAKMDRYNSDMYFAYIAFILGCGPSRRIRQRIKRLMWNGIDIA
jgi:hypothetical protein